MTCARKFQRSLAHLDLFKGVSLESLEYQLENCTVISVEAGAVILKSGQHNHCIYSVITGALDLYLDSLESAPYARLCSGSCVGEMSIIDKTRVSAYVVAAERSELLVIEEEVLWNMITASHNIARNLQSILSSRIRESNKRLLQALDAYKQSEYDANVDSLTGLFNRRWLDPMIEKQLKRCTHDDKSLSVILLDADHFKKVNDRYGHLIGDKALLSIANCIKKNLRAADMAARYGGEEFIVLLPDVELNEAVFLAERLRVDIAKMGFLTDDPGRESPLTVSIGVAQSKHDFSSTDLLENADKALYRAKQNGRNRVES